MKYTQIDLNISNTQEARKNIGYLRNLYILFWVENTITILWILLCNYWSNDVGNWVFENWWLVIVTGIIALSLLVAVSFMATTRVEFSKD